MLILPSSHVTWGELACKDGTPYPREFKDDGRLARLMALFEAIRVSCEDRPLVILSAYRTPEHNAAIGGARHSQHVQGRALDIRPPAGWTAARFYRHLRGLASSWPDLKGIGHYPTFVHVDVRPGVRLVVWSGAGVKDDTAT